MCVVAMAQSQPSQSNIERRSADELLRREDARREQLERQLLPRELSPSPDPAPDPLTSPSPSGTALGRLPHGEQPCFVVRHISLFSPAIRPAPTTAALENLERLVLQAIDTPLGDDAPPSRDPVRGACLGGAGVARVVQRAQYALTDAGYTTSRVLAAPQNLSSGTLQLVLIPGVISRVEIDAGPDRPPALPNVMKVTPGTLLNLRDLEQMLDDLRRVSGVEATLQIEAETESKKDDIDSGSGVGGSVVRLRYRKATPINLVAVVDDSGTPATGIYQGNVTVSLNSPLGLSDLFYVTMGNDVGGQQSGPRGTHNSVAHYSLPWRYWTAEFTYSASRYSQSAAGLNGTYVYSGTSETTEGGLSRVLMRDAVSRTELRTKAFQRRSNNYLDNVEIEVQRRVVGGFDVGLAHRRRMGDANLDASFAIKAGTGAFGAMAAPEEARGEGTSRFGLITYNLAYGLGFEMAGQSLHYGSTLRLQNNLTPLTPQDRFSIGNRYTVRGFDGLSTLTADRGWWLRNELALDVVAATQAYAGLDYGEVQGGSADQLVGQSLAGAVLGWRGAISQQAVTWQFDGFVGFPLYMPQGMKSAPMTTGFSLMLMW